MTDRGESQTILERAERLMSYGEYREARQLFAEILASPVDANEVRRAALGSAKASQRLIDAAGVIAALDHPHLSSKEFWPPADAAEAALLAARAKMGFGQVPEAAAELDDALRYAAAHLGYASDGAMSAAEAASLISTHPDVKGSERLASAAMAKAEFHSAFVEIQPALEWLNAAARVVGRSLSLRSLELLTRINAANGLISERAFEFGDPIAILEALPLQELESKAWMSSVERETSSGLSPADAVEMIAQTRITDDLMRSGHGEIMLREAEAAIAELDSSGADRLAAMARFHFARLLVEKAIALATIDFKALPWNEQHEARENLRYLKPEIDPRIETVLHDAIAVFNRNRPDFDGQVVGGLIMLADAYWVRDRPEEAERILHHAIAACPVEPAAVWRGCMMLASILANREALATAAFWAKTGLLGLSAFNQAAGKMFSSDALAEAGTEPHIETLINLLRRLGRLQEASQISEIAHQGQGGELICCTNSEGKARARLLQHLATIDATAPVDLSATAPIHDYIAAVEEMLEVPVAGLPSLDYVPPSGVALLTIEPAGNGVSLRLRSGEIDWAKTVASSFPPAHPLQFAVDSLFESFSKSVVPSAPWPDGIFAKTWVEQVSEDILGALPPFQAHTLLLRTGGVFRFLPFAPIGVDGPILDILPLQSCPQRMIKPAPLPEEPTAAIFALDADELEGVRSEADLLSDLLGDARVFSRIGLSANEAGLTELLRGDADILHIATHCDANAAEPAASRLLLGDGTNLTIGELASHDLSRFRLVTLAACASGRPGGASHVTPADLLHEAGAQRVLTALWPVDDLATALLMQEFYGALLKTNGLSFAAALRHAQRKTRAVYPHPYFWAGFYLSGFPDSPAQARD